MPSLKIPLRGRGLGRHLPGLQGIAMIHSAFSPRLLCIEQTSTSSPLSGGGMTVNLYSCRFFSCKQCQRLVHICRWCDRGHRYCSTECAQEARRESQRRSGALYQATDRGKKNHAARQQRYLMRRMTHRSSPQPDSDISLFSAHTIGQSEEIGSPSGASQYAYELPKRNGDVGNGLDSNTLGCNDREHEQTCNENNDLGQNLPSMHAVALPRITDHTGTSPHICCDFCGRLCAPVARKCFLGGKLPKQPANEALRC